MLQTSYIRQTSHPYFAGSKPAKKHASERFIHKAETKGRTFFNKKMERQMAPIVDQIHPIAMAISEDSPGYIDFVLEAGRMIIARQPGSVPKQKEIDGFALGERISSAFIRTFRRILPLGGPIEVEVNDDEDDRLKNIIDSKEACIFIMNHDDQIHDPITLLTFIHDLYRAYDQAGLKASCPRPKIIINRDIIDTLGEKQRQIFEKLGAVGVDASVSGKDQASRDGNAQALAPVISGFIKDQYHVFIFPEGRNAVAKNRPMDQKFQRGIGRIVSLASLGKKRVKVVPVGFAYKRRKNESLGSIYIGKPVYFVPDGKRGVYVNTANVTPENASPLVRKFFYGDDAAAEEAKPVKKGRFKKLFVKKRDQAEPVSAPEKPTETTKDAPVDPNPFKIINGEPHKLIVSMDKPDTAVKGKELADKIADDLRENLEICREEALKMLPTESLGDKVEKPGLSWDQDGKPA